MVDENSLWSNTNIICQIVKSSIESLDLYIGRLISFNYDDSNYSLFSGRFGIVSFDPSEYSKTFKIRNRD